MNQENVYAILLVEDDKSLISGLSFAIEKQGYALGNARTCAEAELLWKEGAFDLVILDVSLPDGTGFDICKMIRQVSKVPIIFLTAADEETDIIMGLDMGGDDYITKPFKLAVLLSKINAILRRTNRYSNDLSKNKDILCSHDITIHLLKSEVYKREKQVELTAGEYKLLRLLMEHPDQILSPEQILSRLWDCDENYVDNNTLTVYIRRLRMKIEEDSSSPKRIVTVRRMGYKWSTVD